VLLDRGAVRPLVDSVLALEQAPTALGRLEAGGVRGKIALLPPAQAPAAGGG
jgi:NADPH:quinone reductase-like Zn-dependent oxidoreductase